MPSQSPPNSAFAAEPAVERLAAAAAIGLAAAIALAPLPTAPFAIVGILLVVCWIIWRDARDLIIPDAAAFSLAALAFAVQQAGSASPLEGLSDATLGAVVCGGALWLVREAYYRIRGFDGLGFGDVKLAGSCGALLGPFGFSIALLAASLLGVLTVLARRGARTDRIAFGALLAPAVFAVWLAGSAGWF